MINLIILDVDGVMTDGTKIYDDYGRVTSKRFNDRDFTAIKRFKAAGVSVCFLSGDANINKEIAKNRNIDFYHSRGPDGKLDKVKFLPFLLSKYKATKETTAYVGDDYFDLEIMKEVDNRFCPSDAILDVKWICYNLKVKGGDGVVADLYEYCCSYGRINQASYTDVIALDAKESQ